MVTQINQADILRQWGALMDPNARFIAAGDRSQRATTNAELQDALADLEQARQDMERLTPDTAYLLRLTASERRQFAADCAEMCLHLYEMACPDDDRPRRAIQAARDYAVDRIDDDALKTASDRANHAAWELTTESAARSAAFAASSAAAEDWALRTDPYMTYWLGFGAHRCANAASEEQSK